MRKTKNVGDWIGAFSSKRLHEKYNIPQHSLVYLAEVSEVLTLDDYFNDNRFRSKKPDIESSNKINSCGDNVYYLKEDEYHQLENIHHDDGHTEHDTSGENVLISNKFYYFGKSAIHPEILSSMDISIPSGQSNYGVKSSDESLYKLLSLVASSGYDDVLIDNPCEF